MLISAQLDNLGPLLHTDKVGAICISLGSKLTSKPGNDEDKGSHLNPIPRVQSSTTKHGYHTRGVHKCSHPGV